MLTRAGSVSDEPKDVVELTPGKTIAETAIEFASLAHFECDEPSEFEVSVLDRESSMVYPITVVRKIVYEARGLRGELSREVDCGPERPMQSGDLVTAKGSEHYWEEANEQFVAIDDELNKILLGVVVVAAIIAVVSLFCAVT